MASLAINGSGNVLQHHQPSFSGATQTQKIKRALEEKPLKEALSLLKKEIVQLPKDTLADVLDLIATLTKPQDNPEKIIETLVKQLPIVDIEAALKTRYPTFEDAVADAREKIDRCKEFLSTTEVNTSPTLSAKARQIFEGLIAAFEAFLNAFGIADFFQPAKSSMEAQWKSGQLQSIIYFASFLTTTLMSLSIGPVAALIAPAALAVIAAASLIYPYIRPMPSYLPEGVSYSRMVRMQQLPEVLGRKKVQDAIAKTLTDSKEVKKHPLLVGQTGVGKTKTIEAFVHAIERGDYPSLKGKQVFYFSTGKLIHASAPLSGGNDILDRISDAMGRHRENIILVFDEIHEIAKAKADSSALGEQLKILLDPGPKGFPHLIGMTTHQEMEKHIDSALRRRFQEIVVPSTNKQETLHILTNYLQRNHPTLLIEEGVLSHLYEKCQELEPAKVEPARSLAALEKCLSFTGPSQPLQHEAEYQETKSKVDDLRSQCASLPLSAPAGEKEASYKEALSTLAKLEALLAQERQERTALLKDLDNLLQLKKKVCKIALRLHPLSDKRSHYLLASYFFFPQMEKEIIDRCKRCKLDVRLTKELVEKVLNPT
jgi:hypothetical protein